MEKLKAFLIKYKWFIAGGAGLLVLFYMMRNSGGSSGQVVQGAGSSTAYQNADGSTGQLFGDPSVLLAQLSGQTALASQSQQILGEYNALKLSSELQHYQIETNSQAAMATIEANKWIANLDSSTQLGLAGFSTELGKYQANISSQIAASNNSIQMYEIEANKYIAGRQADIAQSQVKIQKRGQDYQFIGGLISSASNYFK